MALFEGKTPAERNKLIAAIVLPLLALIFVFNMFSGPSRPAPTTTANVNSNSRPGGVRPATTRQQAPGSAAAATDVEFSADVVPIVCCPEPSNVGDAGRNIFAFYVKPTPAPAPVPTVEATPAPTPDKLIAGLMPQSVFARTAGFTLQITGDKFGPSDRIYVNGQELPTQYKSMQQLSANIPATLISSPGARQVKVQTPDGRFTSNEATLNVMQPPAPTYTYVGFLKRQRGNTAVLKDAKGELYSVRQGDLVEGRFRVADISEKGVEVVDKDLNIKHTMPFVDARGTTGVPGRAPGAIQPPPPSEDGGDEEP